MTLDVTSLLLSNLTFELRGRSKCHPDFLFIYLFWLCWVFVAAKAFYNCGVGAYSLTAMHRLLIAVASLAVKSRLWPRGLQLPVTQELSSCAARA